MTANQIMIPIAGLILVCFVVYLGLRTRRARRDSLQRDHRPNAPDDGRDDAAVVRSVMEGHAGGGQP